MAPWAGVGERGGRARRSFPLQCQHGSTTGCGRTTEANTKKYQAFAFAASCGSLCNGQRGAAASFLSSWTTAAVPAEPGPKRRRRYGRQYRQRFWLHWRLEICNIQSSRCWAKGLHRTSSCRVSQRGPMEMADLFRGHSSGATAFAGKFGLISPRRLGCFASLAILPNLLPPVWAGGSVWLFLPSLFAALRGLGLRSALGIFRDLPAASGRQAEMLRWTRTAQTGGRLPRLPHPILPRKHYPIARPERACSSTPSFFTQLVILVPGRVHYRHARLPERTQRRASRASLDGPGAACRQQASGHGVSGLSIYSPVFCVVLTVLCPRPRSTQVRILGHTLALPRPSVKVPYGVAAVAATEAI